MQEAIFNPLQTAWLRVAEQLGALFPKIVGFIIIVIIGWLLSKLFAFIIKKLLLLVRLNVVSEKAGIEDFLKKGGIKKSSVDILSTVTYWFFLLITFIVAFNAAGLAVVSDLLNTILFYIPNVFVALVVVLIGFYIAKLLSASVKVFAVNLGITRPDIAAKAANYLVLFFVFVIALEQLGISRQIVTSAFSIALGAIGLGAAIAIGLGSKDIVADWWKKSRLKKKE